MIPARLVLVAWWLQLKIRSRSAFDGLLGLLWPLFFATTVFLMFRAGTAGPAALPAAAVGASVMGVWSSTSTSAAFALQMERRQGTLELLVAAPTPFPLLVLPLTLSMATVGLYSMVATLLWGRLVFGIAVPLRDVPGFLAATVVTAVAIGVLGFLLAIASVRYRSAWALGSALEMPVWLVCGFLVPLGALPGWVRPLSWLLAPTWGVAAIRGAATGGAWFWQLLACAGLAAGYALAGTLLARRVVDSARRHATLALS